MSLGSQGSCLGRPSLPSRSLLASFSSGEVTVWRQVGGASRRGPTRGCRLYLSLPSLLHDELVGDGRIQGVRLQRGGFEALLNQAVLDEHAPSLYPCEQSWRLATRFAPVSIRWIQDMDRRGRPLSRQVPLLSLRPAALRQLSEQWIASIEGWRGGPAPALRPYPAPPTLLARLVGRNP
ncbi:MAG TPA: DUF4291 family protein [Deltaproteobacteria bacterium]|nr:DUF4291 family protein [Deltaproteobacteria bacterium]